ncbi:MAG: M24 family metallopeptidase [Acidobacteria bacterium]|nr:M24 family metallopeptidase [Acidobacteriota bacterium]
MIRRSLLLAGGLALAAGGCAPASAPEEELLPTEALDIPDARERAQIRKDLITKRLDTVVLPAMRAHDIDMWLTFSREHHVDPILSEIGGGWGGVRNAYIFFDHGGDTPEKIFIGSHSLRDPTISDAYDVLVFYGYTEEGVRPHLRRVIEERDPRRIGINVSPTLPMADGLTWTLRNFLDETLGETYAARMVSAELVIRDFREMHIPEEIPVFSDLCAWTVAWEEEAFSDAVVTVGETTVADIHWWMRQRAMELGLITEFLPGVRITRDGENLPINSPDHVVMPGDILSVDAGVGYLDYRTDIKRTAYVLRPGETEAPESIQNAWEKALEITDILTGNWKPGAIAHEVWEQTMEDVGELGYQSGQPKTGGNEEVDPRQPEVGVYSHSVGNSTHDIGARVAVDWPFAYGDRVRYPLKADAWYSVELHVSTPIPEWDGLVLPIRIEENARVLPEGGVEYFAPRQRELLLIGGAQ